jgi:hypothetical protein
MNVALSRMAGWCQSGTGSSPGNVAGVVENDKRTDDEVTELHVLELRADLPDDARDLVTR